MKRWIVAGMLLLVGAAYAGNSPALWVTVEYRERNDRVLLIRDNQTGTRCYAVTNDSVNTSGYAISCVK